MKNFLYTLSINIAVIITILLVFEYTLPYFYYFNVEQGVADTCESPLNISYIDTQGPVLVRDTEIGFFLNPAEYYANGHGFLGDCHVIEKQKNELRIAVVGDSFTASVQVDISKTWPELLKGVLATKFPDKKVSLYNFGVGGAGLDQQNGQLRAALEKYNPDIIVQSTYLGNDFTDSSYYIFKRSQAPHKQFSLKNHLDIIGNDITKIDQRVDYYLMMNFMRALTDKNRLYLNGEPVDINSQWKWNDSKYLKDRFEVSLQYKNELFTYKSHRAYPLENFKAGKVALQISFESKNKKVMELDVLRHDSDLFDWKSRFMVASLKLIDANGTQSAEEQLFVAPTQQGVLFKNISTKETTPLKQSVIYPFWRSISFINAVLENYSDDKNKDDSALNFNFSSTRKIDEKIGVPYPYQIYMERLPQKIETDLKGYEYYLKESIQLHDQIDKSVFATIPSAFSAVEEYWEQADEAYFSPNGIKANRVQPDLLFKDMAKKNTLKYISFSEYIHAYPKGYIKTLYDIKHRHFTLEGHKVYERFIRERITPLINET